MVGMRGRCKVRFALLLVLLLGVGRQGQAPTPATLPSGEGVQANSGARAQAADAGIHGRRGVYLTAYSLAKPGFLLGILELLETFGLDTVVINVKDMHGEVSYATEVELAHRIGAAVPRLPLADILAEVHGRGMYAIARQVVFYDPKFSAFLGSPHHPWVLPTAEAVTYNLAIARELEQLGFDEVQFDYVRFPDDGPIGPDYSGRAVAVEAFLSQAQEQLLIPISVDVFGRVLWPWNARKIDPIGQHLEGMAPHVDLFSPMLYPSHYVEQELKDDPYGTVRRALEYGMARVTTPMRPFLQAFDMAIPAGMTLPQYIAAQLRAAEEMGADGYLFWHPGSDYSALWAALELLGRP